MYKEIKEKELIKNKIPMHHEKIRYSSPHMFFFLQE